MHFEYFTHMFFRSKIFLQMHGNYNEEWKKPYLRYFIGVSSSIRVHSLYLCILKFSKKNVWKSRSQIITEQENHQWFQHFQILCFLRSFQYLLNTELFTPTTFDNYRINHGGIMMIPMFQGFVFIRSFSILLNIELFVSTTFDDRIIRIVVNTAIADL